METKHLTYWCVLRRVAGCVAGGCWDDDITSLLVMTGIIPEKTLRLSMDWFKGQFTGLSPIFLMGKSWKIAMVSC